MALITCPECGNQVSDKARTCPQCGFTAKETLLDKTQKRLNPHKKAVIICLSIALVGILYLVITANTLNQHEKEALENCKTLKSMMVNPSSFALYDDILVYPDDEDYGTRYFISFGGTNSYGGMVQDIAIFEDTTYLGRFSNDESDFNSLKEHDHFLIAKMPYTYDVVVGNNFADFKKIDAEKIMRHL